MNHHELFAGVPGVQSAMQLFARRVAGLGRLPDAAKPPTHAHRRKVDVLVIGCGAAGMAVAVALARNGRKVEVVDDALTPGGGTRAFLDDEDPGFTAIRTGFRRAVDEGVVVMRSRTVAAGFFGRDLLVVGESGAEVVEAMVFVIAVGAHDGVVPFENNDFPGVMSARAACLLLASGVSLGKRVVLLTPPRGEPGLGEVAFGDLFERTAAASRVTRVEEVLRAKGSSHLRAVIVRDGVRERSLSADVLLVDAPRAPAYELCQQAGAALVHGPAGYTPVLDRGRIADGVWAIGEVTGAPLAAGPFVQAAEAIAAQLAAS